MINKVVVGLGNPGKGYENTRHNCGFFVVDYLAGEYGASAFKGKFRGACAECSIGAARVLLLKPQTFMNLSGDSVIECLRFYSLAASDIILIYDDCDLPAGKLRVRREGSAGGHNGVKSVIARLGTQTFDRIKIGIGEKPERMDLADYVLSKFTKDEREDIDAAVIRAGSAAERIIREGAESAMNLFNG